MTRPSHATIVAYLALFAAVGGGAVAIGQAGGDSDQEIRGCVIKRGAERGQLRVVTKGKCKPKRERALTWNQRGPAGARGPAGSTGLTGPPGSPASGMLMGWIRPAEMPSIGSATDLTPLGDARDSVGTIPVTPNAPTVFRDLFVRAQTAPGVGTRWSFTLQGTGASDVLTCNIVGAFNTACDSGSQSFTVAPGGSLRLQVADVGGATPTNVWYAYRAESP